MAYYPPVCPVLLGYWLAMPYAALLLAFRLCYRCRQRTKGLLGVGKVACWAAAFRFARAAVVFFFPGRHLFQACT